MLSSTQAARIGRRGGNNRTRNLSAEVRSEIAAWAQLIRQQRSRGETTDADLNHRLIHLVQSENPDTAALLRCLARLPLRLASEIYLKLPADQLELVERKITEVLLNE